MVLGVLIMLNRHPCIVTTVVETQTFMGREVVTSSSGVLSKELKHGGGRLLASA